MALLSHDDEDDVAEKYVVAADLSGFFASSSVP